MVEPVWIEASELPNAEPLKEGYQRTWMKCPECGVLQYYDFVPYSMSNPILTTLCGHDQIGRKLHEYMIPVKVVGVDPQPVLTPVQSFRSDADHNYEDFIMNSGEFVMAMTRRDECLKKFPTVSACCSVSGVVPPGEGDIDEATTLGLIRGILCAVENAISEAFEEAGLYSPDQLASTRYEDEEIDIRGTIRGRLLLEYTDGQNFSLGIELPMEDYNDDEKLDTFIQHILPGEKEFEIEQYELHVTTYNVKAKTRAEAIAAVINGTCGESTSTEYVQVLHEYGMPTEGFERYELADIEARIQARLLPDLIDSIRSVKKV